MQQEYKIEKDNLKILIKSLTTMEDMTLTKMKILVNHKFNKTDSLENLTNKLRRKTIKVSELIEILDVLGYEAIARKKQ